MDSLILFGDERMLNLRRVASFGSTQSFGEMQRLPDVCGMLSATYYSTRFRRKRTDGVDGQSEEQSSFPVCCMGLHRRSLGQVWV